jgi:uncharacterized membrane protein
MMARKPPDPGERVAPPADSPSSFRHRGVVAVLAVAGGCISVYLALYQWDVVSRVWDPIFGSKSSSDVLTSALSRALPVPDAALGAAAYAAEVVLTLAGGRDRWSSEPWLVAAFGLVVAALALTSVALVFAQIFVFRSGCTLCLTSAGISFINAWLARSEVAATARLLLSRGNTGQPFWTLFWGGIHDNRI